MLHDAAKRIEFLLKRVKTDADYRALLQTAYVYMLAVGRDDLAEQLVEAAEAATPPAPEALVALLHPVGDTAWDKYAPWLFGQIRAKPSNKMFDKLIEIAHAIPAWAKLKKIDLNAVSLADVVGQFDTALAPAGGAAPDRAIDAVATGEPIVYAFPDGHVIQRLETDAALRREGKALDHCVGQRARGYCAAVTSGDTVIYSLRDPHGTPLVTLEWNVRAARFQQIFGEGNTPPRAAWTPYLVAYIDAVHGGEPLGIRRAGGKLAGRDLTGADLTDADLYRADLTDANLTGADLIRANLTHANLTRANLTGADLTGANLTGAVLTGAYLSRAILVDADLTRANLTDADLTGADLRGAYLIGAYLTGAYLTGADLTRANLRGAFLTFAKFDPRTTMPDGSKWRPEAGLGRRARRF